MSQTEKEMDEPKRPIPGKTYDPQAEITTDTPDEPAGNEDDLGPVDDDRGVIGVGDDDTIGINQADDDRR